MIWSILIASLARRGELLSRVLGDLGPQLALYQPMIEVVVYRNHGEIPLGDIRQALVDEARGEYLNFVDDDDRLPNYYVSEVLPLLDGTIDYVGWRMQAYRDGYPLKPTYHTLTAGRWYETDTAYFRDFSHLNPIRASLARCADFRRADPPEDVSWSEQLHEAAQGLELRQAVVPDDKIMYHYYGSQHDTSWRPGSEPPWNGSDDLLTQPTAHRFDDVPGFRWHPSST